MYVASGVRVHEEQAVVRIRERAIGGKTDRRASCDDEIEPGMLTTREAPAEHLRRESVGGERHEFVPRQLHDRCRVALDRTTDGLEEAGKAVLSGQRDRQIDAIESNASASAMLFST